MKKITNHIIRFIIMNILVLALISPFALLYGPFPNIRNTVIGAVATSMHEKWLYYILSDAQVNKLLADSRGNGNSTQVISKFINGHSNDPKLTRITSSRFKGYLLEIGDPTRLKVGVAETLGQKGQTTSEIARQNGAIAAVNAGGFSDPNGTGNGHILLLVIDGRQPQYSLGATLVDVQNILFDNGAIVAANLDGGSSTTMYYQGKVINQPCDLLGERFIPTAFVVM
jgi:exopolysaccharide biosynthesis protein